MPGWVLVLGAVAFVVTSLLTIWTKAIRPGAKVISEWERMLPVWRRATDALEDIPEAFDILKEIVAQVRNNSGSSILDMIEKLSRQIDIETSESHKLAVSLEADRQLAIRDREQLTRLLIQQDHAGRRIDAAVEILARMAAGDKEVAANLVVAQQEVDLVAVDLKAGHQRAADVPPGSDHGAAADAQARPE